MAGENLPKGMPPGCDDASCLCGGSPEMRREADRERKREVYRRPLARPTTTEDGEDRPPKDPRYTWLPACLGALPPFGRTRPAPFAVLPARPAQRQAQGHQRSCAAEHLAEICAVRHQRYRDGAHGGNEPPPKSSTAKLLSTPGYSHVE
jgi:hypothetical protein